MGINLSNYLFSKSKNRKMTEFQDLDHLDGLSISCISANLYENTRDDLVMFYFREGANFASVYTQSKIISEFLPEQLTELELTEIINSTIRELNASSMKEIGAVISLVNNKVSGRAEGRLIAEIVKKKLSN